MIRGAGLRNFAHVTDGAVFPWSLVESLRCPCCGSRLEICFELRSSREGINDGVLRCDCYEYPVVSGIAVLRHMGSVSSSRNEAVERLKKRDSANALHWLLQNGSAKGVPGQAAISAHGGRGSRLVRRLRDLFRKNLPPPVHDPIPLSNGYKAFLYASRPQGYADYLFYRFANPSLLGDIPCLVVFAEACRKKAGGRILDMSCGVGHTSAILGVLCPEMEIVAADIDFVNLFIAKQWVAPRAVTLCIDAELPLPFENMSIRGFHCLDGLHYMWSKGAFLNEVDRVVNEDGFWLFAHMHNADRMNENPGAPLTANGYARRFAFGRQRMLPETEGLQQFQVGGSLDLTVQADETTLTSCHAFTLVGARTEELWKMHTGLVDELCHRPDLVAFNPLYTVKNASGGLDLVSAWPSESLRLECIGNMPVLPETVHVAQRVVDEIAALRATGSLSDDVRKLLMSYVLVILPECYLRMGSTA